MNPDVSRLSVQKIQLCDRNLCISGLHLGDRASGRAWAKLISSGRNLESWNEPMISMIRMKTANEVRKFESRATIQANIGVLQLLSPRRENTPACLALSYIRAFSLHQTLRSSSSSCRSFLSFVFGSCVSEVVRCRDRIT